MLRRKFISGYTQKISDDNLNYNSPIRLYATQNVTESSETHAIRCKKDGQTRRVLRGPPTSLLASR